jgi:hypothetical protein
MESHNRLCRSDNTHDCCRRRRHQLFDLGQKDKELVSPQRTKLRSDVSCKPASQDSRARSAARCQATFD